MVDKQKEFTKQITLLSLKYQEYLTNLGIIWTIGISFFVAIVSYILISWTSLKEDIAQLTMLLSILLFIEIAFIAVYFWLSGKRIENKKQISRL